MQVKPSRIRDIDDSQRNCTITRFRQFRYVDRAGRMTVIIHPLDGSYDGSSRSPIDSPPEANGVFILQDGILASVIDGTIVIKPFLSCTTTSILCKTGLWNRSLCYLYFEKTNVHFRLRKWWRTTVCSTLFLQQYCNVIRSFLYLSPLFHME